MGDSYGIAGVLTTLWPGSSWYGHPSALAWVSSLLLPPFRLPSVPHMHHTLVSRHLKVSLNLEESPFFRV